MFSFKIVPFLLCIIEITTGQTVTRPTETTQTETRQTVQPTTDPIYNFCEARMTTMGEGYFRIPGYCNIFVHCNTKTKPELQTCASGTFFDGSGCSHASAVTCTDDPCKRLPEGTQFSDGGNCFGYYECRGKKAYYEHCPVGQAFNQTMCMPDLTCVHPDTVVSSNRVNLPGCPSHIAADSLDTTRYFLIDGVGNEVLRNCSPGLVFSPTVCGCDWPDSSQVTQAQITGTCNSAFTFPFHGDFQELQKRVYMKADGNVFIQNDRVYIDNQGALVIPYMENVKLGSNFALQFTFKYGGDATDNVTILTNQDQYYPYTYNIELRPLSREVRVDLVLTDGSSTSLAVANVDPLMEHTLRLGKSGDLIQLQIDNSQPVSVTAQAGIDGQPSALSIGSTVSGNPFIGYIDDISLYRCQPAQFYA